MIIDQRYKEVKAGIISEFDFLQEAHQDKNISRFITGFHTFDQVIEVLKSRSMLFEETEVDNNKGFDFNTIIKEALSADVKGTVHPEHVHPYEFEKGWRYELKLIGKFEDEDINKAKAKAVKNLEKDPIHYTKIEMGEYAPDNKGHEMLDLSKGKNMTDPDNQMKPVKKVPMEDTESKKYTDDVYNKGKAPKSLDLKKKSSLNEGLSLPSGIVKNIEKIKNGLHLLSKKDKFGNGKYEETVEKLEAVLDKDASGLAKTLKANIEEASPDFPNQESGEDFRSRLNDIYAVYASIRDANDLDEKSEDFLPASLANPIIEALRSYITHVKDNELSPSYKYLKEDVSAAVGNLGLSGILQKITGLNLGASQSVSNLKDAITKVGGGNYDQGLNNVKALFKNNGGGTPEKQIDTLKDLIDKGISSGDRLSDIFSKANSTFGNAQGGNKVFSILGSDKELVQSSVKTLAQAAGKSVNTIATDHNVQTSVKAAAKAGKELVSSDHVLQNIATNILTPIGITMAIGAVIWGAAELKKQKDSRLADIKSLLNEIKLVTKEFKPERDYDKGEDVEDKTPKSDNPQPEKTKEEEPKEEPVVDKVETTPTDDKSVVDNQPEKPSTPKEKKTEEEKGKKEKKQTSKAKEPEEEKVSVAKEEEPKKEEPKKVSDKPKPEVNSKVKAILWDPEYYKGKVNAKVVSLVPASDKGNKKYKPIKFGVSNDVHKMYMEGEPAQKKKLRDMFALIAAKVKSDTKSINVDLTKQDVKSIEKVAKGKIKIATSDELKEGIEFVFESSSLDDMIKNHNNNKKPNITNPIVSETKLEEAVRKVPDETNYPVYVIQNGNKFIAGFDKDADARHWATSTENKFKKLSVVSRDEVSKMKNMKLTDPNNWNNIGTNNFMWKTYNENLEKLREALRPIVRKRLLEAVGNLPTPEGPDVYRKELERQLKGVTWPAVGQPDKDSSYKMKVDQEKINSIQDLMGKFDNKQEAIDIYNEYAPDGCKWGEDDDLFSMKEDAEDAVPQIHQELQDLQDLDPKDLAKMANDKKFPAGSVKYKFVLRVLGSAIKDGNTDSEVKKAFLSLADQFKK